MCACHGYCCSWQFWYMANPPALEVARETGGIAEEGKQFATAFLLQNASAQPCMTKDQYHALYSRCIRALVEGMSIDDINDVIKVCRAWALV